MGKTRRKREYCCRDTGLSVFLLQFIALALPAIAIYLQILVSVYRTDENAEIEGTVPKAVESLSGERTPEHDPNVIEAIPVDVTEANLRLDFILALGSLVVFLSAAYCFIIRILISWGFLIPLGTFLSVIALILFTAGVPVTIHNSIRRVLDPS
ncbi:MAG: hypothetical protein V5A61_05235 [Haloarculaceae archaeon]